MNYNFDNNSLYWYLSQHSKTSREFVCKLRNHLRCFSLILEIQKSTAASEWHPWFRLGRNRDCNRGFILILTWGFMRCRPQVGRFLRFRVVPMVFYLMVSVIGHRLRFLRCHGYFFHNWKRFTLRWFKGRGFKYL